MPITAVESFVWGQIPETAAPHPGITKRTCSTERLTLVRYEFANGAVFPRHAHPEWQVTIVESGTMTFDYGDRVESYGAGAIISIPGGLSHEGRAEHGPVTITCIFTPPRVQI
jgi:quercetin dioxygenase-like cupin family protein